MATYSSLISGPRHRRISTVIAGTNSKEFSGGRTRGCRKLSKNGFYESWLDRRRLYRPHRPAIMRRNNVAFVPEFRLERF